MRIIFLASAAVATVVLGSTPQVGAQWTSSKVQLRSIIGDRTLGEPLAPGHRWFGGGLLRGPSGNFLGRGRAEGGMMFSGASRPSVFAPSRDRPIRYWPPPMRHPAPGAIEPAVPPAVEPQPDGGGPSDVWFRSGRSTTGDDSSSRTIRQLPVRPVTRLTLGSDLVPGKVQQVSLSSGVETQLSARISRCAGIEKRSPITVSVRAATATLRGVVATARDRTLAGHVVRMEPGIWQVDNELTVEGEEPREY